MTHFRALTLILAFSKGLIRLSLTDLEETAHAKAFPFSSCFCGVMFVSSTDFRKCAEQFHIQESQQEKFIITAF